MKRIAFLLILLIAGSAIGQEKADDRKAMIKMCRSLLKEAVAEIDGGRFEPAVALLDSVFQCDPSNPDAFFYKAQILGWQADTAGVMELLASGVEKAPLSARLKLMLARYKIAVGSLEEASKLIDGVLAINARSGEALYLKGRIYQEQGDTLQAIETYKLALEHTKGGTK